MYKLPNNIDPSKVFLINRSELEGRIDAGFYKEKTNYKNCIKLSKIAKVKGGKRIPNNYDYSNEETSYLYLRVTNMNQDLDFNFKKFKYINGEVYTILKRYEIDNNDLIISIAGTIGKVKLLTNKPENKRIILTENCAKIVLNDKNEILPEYLKLILQSEFLKKQINVSYIQTTIPKLGIDKILGLQIPKIPNLLIQKETIDLYNIAYSQKQQKEVQAKQLLKSIDTYLLKELGITLPVKDNSLTNRIFRTSFKEISGGRFDPKLYDSTTIGLKNAIKNPNSLKFKAVPLKEFITQSVAGDWGIDEFDELDDDLIKCLVIRATEFDNNFNLKLDNSRVKYRLIKKDKLAKIDIKENDLLIEKSGGSIDQPVGRVTILTKEILDNKSICYSNFIHKIRIDETKLNAQYLYYFLKIVHNCKLTESMQSQTNGIRNLIMSNYLNQNVVIPINIHGKYDFAKQTEIANYINDLVNEAKGLQEEALVILNQAKQQVEKIILS